MKEKRPETLHFRLLYILSTCCCIISMNACSALVLIDECSKYEKERHKGNFLVLIIVNSLRSFVLFFQSSKLLKRDIRFAFHLIEIFEISKVSTSSFDNPKLNYCSTENH